MKTKAKNQNNKQTNTMRVCCDGECLQGRECPLRRKEQPARSELPSFFAIYTAGVLAILGLIVLVSCLP